MKRILANMGLGILVVLAVAGCSFGLTLEWRIQQFADDLNLADRTDIYLNFHPTSTLDYSDIRDTDYFLTSLPKLVGGDTPYVISIIDQTNPAAVNATIESSAMGVGVYDAIFSMALDGMDYKIAQLWIDYGSGMTQVVY
jgi:hypothetical protein